MNNLFRRSFVCKLLLAILFLFSENHVFCPPTREETQALTDAQTAYKVEVQRALAANNNNVLSVEIQGTANYISVLHNATAKFNAMITADPANADEWRKLADKMSAIQDVLATKTIPATTGTSLQVVVKAEQEQTNLRRALQGTTGGSLAAFIRDSTKTLTDYQSIVAATKTPIEAFHKVHSDARAAIATQIKAAKEAGATEAELRTMAKDEIESFKTVNLLDNPDDYEIRPLEAARRTAAVDLTQTQDALDAAIGEVEKKRLEKLVVAQRETLKTAEDALEKAKEEQKATRVKLRALEAVFMRAAGDVTAKTAAEAHLAAVAATVEKTRDNIDRPENDLNLSNHKTTIAAKLAQRKAEGTELAQKKQQAVADGDKEEAKRLTKIIQFNTQEIEQLAKTQSLVADANMPITGALDDGMIYWHNSQITNLTDQLKTARTALDQAQKALDDPATSVRGKVSATQNQTRQRANVKTLEKELAGHAAIVEFKAQEAFEAAQLASLQTDETAKQLRFKDALMSTPLDPDPAKDAALRAKGGAFEFLSTTGLDLGKNNLAETFAKDCYNIKGRDTYSTTEMVAYWKTTLDDSVATLKTHPLSDARGRAAFKARNTYLSYLIAHPQEREKIYHQANALHITATKAYNAVPAVATAEMRAKWYSDTKTAAIYRQMLTDHEQIVGISGDKPEIGDSSSKWQIDTQEVFLKRPEVKAAFKAAAKTTLQEMLTAAEANIRTHTDSIKNGRAPKPKETAQELRAALVERAAIAKAINSGDPTAYLLNLGRNPDPSAPRDFAKEFKDSPFAKNLFKEFSGAGAAAGAGVGVGLGVGAPGALPAAAGAGAGAGVGVGLGVGAAGVLPVAAGAGIAGFTGTREANFAKTLAKAMGYDKTKMSKKAIASAALEGMAQVMSDPVARPDIGDVTAGAAAAFAGDDEKEFKKQLKAAGVSEALRDQLAIAVVKQPKFEIAKPLLNQLDSKDIVQENLATRLSKKQGTSERFEEIENEADLKEIENLKGKLAQDRITKSREAVKKAGGIAVASRELPPGEDKYTVFVVVDDKGKPVRYTHTDDAKTESMFLNAAPSTLPDGHVVLTFVDFDLNTVRAGQKAFAAEVEAVLGDAINTARIPATSKLEKRIRANTMFVTDLKTLMVQQHAARMTGHTEKISLAEQEAQVALAAKNSIPLPRASREASDQNALDKEEATYRAALKAAESVDPKTSKITIDPKKQLAAEGAHTTRLLALSIDQIRILTQTAPKDLVLESTAGKPGYEAMERAAGIALVSIDSYEAIKSAAIENDPKLRIKGQPTDRRKIEADLLKLKTAMNEMRKKISTQLNVHAQQHRTLREARSLEEAAYEVVGGVTTVGIAQARRDADEAIKKLKKTHEEALKKFHEADLMGTSFRPLRTLETAGLSSVLIENKLFKAKSELASALKLQAAGTAPDARALRATISELTGKVERLSKLSLAIHKQTSDEKIKLEAALKQITANLDAAIEAKKAAVKAKLLGEASNDVVRLSADIEAKTQRIAALKKAGVAVSAQEAIDLEALRENLKKAVKITQSPDPLAELRRIRAAAALVAETEGKLDPADRIVVVDADPTMKPALAEDLKKSRTATLAEEPARSPFSKVTEEARRAERAKFYDLLDEPSKAAIVASRAKTAARAKQSLEKRALESDGTAVGMRVNPKPTTAQIARGAVPPPQKGIIPASPPKGIAARFAAAIPLDMARAPKPANAPLSEKQLDANTKVIKPERHAIQPLKTAISFSTAMARAALTKAAMAHAEAGGSEYKFSFASKYTPFRKKVLSTDSQAKLDQQIADIKAEKNRAQRKVMARAHLQALKFKPAGK